MKRFPNHLIGIDNGDVTLFSDFEDGGEMWTGDGPRERRKHIAFSQAFCDAPVVHASISLWDVDNSSAVRSQLLTENVSVDGFDLVFRTWSDTRVARVRVTWMAIGELPHVDQWELY